MTEEEYIDFLRAFAPNDEALIGEGISDHEQAREEFIDFIRKNNLDCSHLRDYTRDDWEKTEGDWEKFVEKYLELKDKYDLWDIPDDEEND